MWQEPREQPPYHALRLRVESLTGERREFESADALAAYLRALMEPMPGDAAAEETDAPRS
jgi:hypothetical protein